MELILVQAVWRHGDRSPTRTFPTDPFQEKDWTFGGGGFGQLSPIGMKQHLNFGKLLRRIYLDEMKFLSKTYSSKEIYIRSTDRNRTLLSAMSNLLGMYGQNDGNAIPDHDYPSEVGWPIGFVPVPIHTVENHIDYVLNPYADCERRDQLWGMAKTSPEVHAFTNRPDVVALLEKLTKDTGTKVTIDNLWIIRDSLLTEQAHKNETLRKLNKWFSDALFREMTKINDKVRVYENGIYNGTLMMNNLDIGNEIQKIRGGSLVNDMYMHMNIKLQCMNKISNDCKWINGLKYYAYSAHDTTVYAFFSIFGIQSKVISTCGYPDYSAGAFVELWLNRTDNEPYFKMRYHQNDGNVTLYPVTHLIDVCDGRKYCSLNVFKAFADRSRSDIPMSELCKIDPRLPPRSSSSLWTFSSTALMTILWTWISIWHHHHVY
nr:Histidine acid phosphatase domain containing protein [Haemonchus contortus]